MQLALSKSRHMSASGTSFRNMLLSRSYDAGYILHHLTVSLCLCVSVSLCLCVSASLLLLQLKSRQPLAEQLPAGTLRSSFPQGP